MKHLCELVSDLLNDQCVAAFQIFFFFVNWWIAFSADFFFVHQTVSFFRNYIGW